MTEDQERYNEWNKFLDKYQYFGRDPENAFDTAWDHQQKKIDKLIKENKKLAEKEELCFKLHIETMGTIK